MIFLLQFLLGILFDILFKIKCKMKWNKIEWEKKGYGIEKTRAMEFTTSTALKCIVKKY